jgi:hypothetical protein
VPQQRSYRLTLELSEAELRAFKNVIDHPFCGDDDDLAGIVGMNHMQIKTAKRMHEKVCNAVERERSKP